ncbi:IS5 family transposase [Sphaerotilus microaerophilus]|uniref:IS5 family transposase n=1 Tax=Sphaerotilus microaerophilus TaxID=2914710 RepID=A0ABM7YNJ4_9BURK|nr:IS5 family transposase [Sphaerotilus sp. FB-5]BDI06016.1 IS5 family transposase [Sphaerotilus sp. FB-5]
MKQADLGLNLSSKRTRKREFLDQMDKVVPWAELVELIAPHCPQRGRKGRQPYEVGAMLRIHFLQQWFGLSDPAMEEALHEVPLYREFTGLDSWSEPLPDESTILRFRHTLEEHKLADKMLATVNDILRERGLMMRSGTVVDATLIAAPSSTKNSSGERDPEMHQTKKGNQWYFGAKSHIAVDAASGLVHTTKFTAANVADVTEANSLLHGEEVRAFGDAGYQGVEKRPDAPGDVEWHTALRPGKRRALDKSDPAQALTDQIERVKASIRSKVEHVFRVVKCQFGYRKVRYRGLAKNGAQMTTLYALANLWLVRRKLLALQA